ncbi:hypothetical protein KDL45_16025, partial [bacterium]|nr:hypothetical protein [bacterium]
MSQRTAAIDGISEKDIVRLLEGMLHFFGNLERYPLTNKIVADDAAGLHKAFVRMIGSSVPTITISELHNALEVNDTELSAAAQNNPVVEAFVFYMLEQNLRSIRISREISLQEFKAFLAMLVASKPSDDLAAQLREKNVRLAHIERQVERTVEETRFDKVPLETRSATRPSGMPRQDPTSPPTT